MARATAARLGVRALFLGVTEPSSWAAFVSEAGPLDVPVNNAGIMPIGSIEKEPEEFARPYTVRRFGPTWKKWPANGGADAAGTRR